jgi:DNA-binding Lrp family transcriptional regulator
MTVVAFVLIETEVGAARSVATACQALDLQHATVTGVSVVTGPYGVIAHVEAEDISTLGTLLTETLHSMSGVQHTVTCIELEP